MTSSRTSTPASRERCRNGHAYTPPDVRPRNWWVDRKGHRRCRDCERAAARRRQRAQDRSLLQAWLEGLQP